MDYKGLIAENIAYPNSRRIGLYDKLGNRVGFAPLGPLACPVAGNKLYTFGALADVHINYDTAETDFQRALTFLNTAENVEFTCIAGDLTGDGTQEQLERFQTVVTDCSPNTPVHAIAGNHEHYSTVSSSYLQNYTGKPLYYSFSHGSDVFIMCGCSSWANDGIFTPEYLQWLYALLEANRNKRCFLFEHVFPANDSGNACGLYESDMFTGEKSNVFQELLKHYKNTVLFHGHSHLKFCLQELDPKANYSNARGYRSVHIPSVCVPRDSVGGVLTDVPGDSEGYAVDVYENCIHLRGRDFVNGAFLPIASFWIDTTLQNIPAGMFTDTSGILQTD